MGFLWEYEIMCEKTKSMVSDTTEQAPNKC